VTILLHTEHLGLVLSKGLPNQHECNCCYRTARTN